MDKANALNLHFSKCFNKSVPPLSPSLQNHAHYLCSDELMCDPDTVAKLITSWSSKTSSSPDKIPITLLKLIPSSITESLAYLFNKSITLCGVPQERKLANITNIQIRWKIITQYPSYLPLAKSISTIMSDHIENNILLSNCQWGFRHGRSTTTALLMSAIFGFRV